MESETLMCPHCGAPYRGIVPSGVVQVKCTYCGAAILVPVYFGGAVNRCPNHPNVVATGLCNDCGRSYCEDCLSLFRVENGALHLCPRCYEARQYQRTFGALIFGVLVFFFGLFFVFLLPGPEGILGGLIFIGFLAIPFLTWGLYRSSNPSRGPTLAEMRQETHLGMNVQTDSEEVPPSSLYDKLLNENLRAYDPRLAYDMLERRISYYTLSGMSRKEAVKKLAEEEGYA